MPTYDGPDWGDLLGPGNAFDPGIYAAPPVPSEPFYQQFPYPEGSPPSAPPAPVTSAPSSGGSPPMAPPAPSQPPATTEPTPPPPEVFQGEPVAPGGPIHDYEGFDLPGEFGQMTLPPHRGPVLEGEILEGDWFWRILRGAARGNPYVRIIIEAAQPEVLGSGEVPYHIPRVNIPAPAPPPIPRVPTREPLPPSLPAPPQPTEVVTVRAPRTRRPPAPRGAPAPSSVGVAGPLFGTIGVLLGGALLSGRFKSPRRREVTAPLTNPLPVPAPAPQPFPLPAQTALPLPSTTTFPLPGPGGGAPPLTPQAPLGVESAPQDPCSCETPRETKRRRNARRSKCRTLVTIRVPAHTKRVCIQDAALYLARKTGRKLGQLAARKVLGVLPKGVRNAITAGKKVKALTRPKRLPALKIPGTNVGFDLKQLVRKP